MLSLEQRLKVATMMQQTELYPYEQYVHAPSIEVTLDANLPIEATGHAGGFHIETTHVTREWRFPKERFITYEKSDEDWCRYCGIGEEVEVVRKLTFPNARIKSMDANSVTIEACAAPATGQPNNQ